MKRPRVAWLVIALVLSSAVLLVLFLPARWVLPFAQTRLHGLTLDRVHGSVWNGAAEQVRGTDGQALGRVQWQLARSALWGRLDLTMHFESAALAFQGRLRRDAQGHPLWTDVAARVALAAWASRLDWPQGTPRGTLALTLQRAVLQGDWPLKLAGQARWTDAVVRASAGPVALGNLGTDLDAANGVLRGRLHDDGQGPLHVEGQWQASPLGWRVDLLLQPRTADPALRHWLAGLGAPGPDGAVRLHRRGGLAAATVESTQ